MITFQARMGQWAVPYESDFFVSSFKQVKNGVQVCDHLFVRGIPSAVQKHQIASLFNRFGQVLWSISSAFHKSSTCFQRCQLHCKPYC